MRETAQTLVTTVACLREELNVLIVCGLHNRVFAKAIMLEAYVVGAYPYLWVFDEDFFLKCSNMVSGRVIAFLPEHIRCLLERSNIVIWLSQYEDLARFPADFRRALSSFWDAVYEVVEGKPRLLVNLPSAKYVQDMDINYEDFLYAFMNSIKVDYNRLRETGEDLASKLDEKSLIYIHDPNGTNLVFSIKDRRVGVENGTLENCLSIGTECEVEVPSGETYVAPIETSANGVLVVDQLRDYGVEKLKLRFDRGKIVSFKARKGSHAFKNMLEKAEGDRDRIAELGIGTNYGLKPVGWNIYDEKALGTAHIAIGNNIHLGGVNKASIHVDFVLHNPTVKADGELIMETGRPLRQS